MGCGKSIHGRRQCVRSHNLHIWHLPPQPHVCLGACNGGILSGAGLYGGEGYYGGISGGLYGAHAGHGLIGF